MDDWVRVTDLGKNTTEVSALFIAFYQKAYDISMVCYCHSGDAISGTLLLYL